MTADPSDAQCIAAREAWEGAQRSEPRSWIDPWRDALRAAAAAGATDETGHDPIGVQVADPVDAEIEAAMAALGRLRVGRFAHDRQGVRDALLAAAAIRAQAPADSPTCGRPGRHLRHGIAITLQCPGIGEQACRPDTYEHLGPWAHVAGSDSLERCAACGTVSGK